MGNAAPKTPTGARKTWKAASAPEGSNRAFIQGSPRPEDLFSNEELKSARLVATIGPFVDANTGKLLREFYAKYLPNEDCSEKIDVIIQSGMELSLLNEKLRDKYGLDLDDFCLQRGDTLH